MSNVEEWKDLDKIITPQIICQNGEPKEWYTEEQLQTHTSQTLQELKAKVNGLKKYMPAEFVKGGHKDERYNKAICDVLQLIEEIER